MKTVRIVIFAKAPLPGLAKTRLIPALGAEGAAYLARQMLDNTLAQALAAAIGPVELCVTPAVDNPVWQSLLLPTGIDYSSQGEGDLGARMGRVARRVIEGGEAIILLGTDAADLEVAHLHHAATLLHNADSTLFPTADGGYILLGLNCFHPQLFAAIPWSTAEVATITQQRIAQLGWSLCTGPLLHDIDEPEDLQWLPQNWKQQWLSP